MVKTLHARAAARPEEIEDYEGEAEPNMKFSHALMVVLLLHVLAVGGVFAFNTLKGHRSSAETAKPPAAQTTVAEDKKAPEPEAASPEVRTTSVPPVAQKPAANAPAAEAPAGSFTTYTVAAGDTLTRIAASQRTTVEAIEQANSLAGNATLRVGQLLKIPSSAAAQKPASKPVVAKAPETKPATETTKVPETVAKTTPPAPKPEASHPAGEKTYTVVKGDNPYSIAKKLKVSYADLIKANKIEDPTKLQIGQQLIVP